MEVLDLRGLKCPLPALIARRALARTAVGGELAIISDDPLAAVDIPYMCDKEGHAVIALEQLESGVRLVLRRNEPVRPA
ncbi:MAG TPA: sulfurtransferase TusA family protein [Rhizomicrobium sp.]|jgi:tRNA 2-thiouridine synthesizing protein A|nr:sulfurtransferase TusA family protein [Rhizomicrobium sp.]